MPAVESLDHGQAERYRKLYPALHRLEKQGWVKSEWRLSEHNQRAKYFQLTASGKKQLESERGRWNQLSAAIAGLPIRAAN